MSEVMASEVNGYDTDTFEVITDGSTVWVNGLDGLMGRFSKFGIDVHTTQIDSPTECLFCTHELPTNSDWQVFVAKMLEHYQVEVSDEYAPNWIELPPVAEP